MREIGLERLTKEVAGKVSLLGISLPTKTSLWKVQPYIILDDFYSIIAKFRTQNSGRGNRDRSRELLAPGSPDGTVKVCQLCLAGVNTEVHLLIECAAMNEFRENQAFGDGTLEEYLESFQGGPDLKYRRVMDWAIRSKNRSGVKRMASLGRMLKKLVEWADMVWFDKLAGYMDV